MRRTIEKGTMPSADEVEKEECAFIESLKQKPTLKKDKGYKLDKDITKIYISAGKKKKIRALDIVGAISNIEGIKSENIGIIDVQDNFSYVDILDGKGDLVIKALKDITIKGKKIRCEKAQK